MHTAKRENNKKSPATLIDSSQQQHTYCNLIQHPENIKGLQKQHLQEGMSAQALSLPDPSS